MTRLSHQICRICILLISVCPIVSASTTGASAGDESKKFVLPESDTGLPGAGPIRRYDWFRNLWQRRRTQFAQRGPAETDHVIFLGDSITQGWEASMAAAFPGVPVANRGISGDTTRGMLIRLQEDVINWSPRGVVLLMGTNDLEEGAAPDVIVHNIGLILKKLQNSDAELPVVICAVFPSSASKKRPAEAIQEINAGLQKLVRESESDKVTLVDTWTLFADEQGDAEKAEFPDLLHPNAAGYAKWAAALKPIFATLGWSETDVPRPAAEDGFRFLFNGRDLTGWGYRATSEEKKEQLQRRAARNANAIPWPIVEEDIAFDGETTSKDERYQAINGRLVVTTPKEGRRIQQLYTTEVFSGDMTLKLEFRATPNADSGVFIRGPQLQCRDFVLAGPWKDLPHYRPQDWNELIVEVRDGVARCTCNGDVLDEAMKIPASGPIGLEGDRGQMEYRNIRVRTAP